MPVLSNPRHESFSQALAKGKTADEAYAQAGFKPNRGNAATLKAKQSIQDRVAEIVGRIAEKAEWSAADRLKSLKTIHDSQIEKDPRVAIAAIAEANKMQGSHAPAKHQHTGAGGGPIQTVDLTNVSDDELARLEAILGVAATGGPTAGDGETGEAEA